MQIDNPAMLRAILAKILNQEHWNDAEIAMAQKYAVFVDQFKSAIDLLLAQEASLGSRNFERPRSDMSRLDPALGIMIRNVVQNPDACYDAETLLSMTRLIETPLSRFFILSDCTAEYNNRQLFEMSRRLLQESLIVRSEPSIEQHWKDSVLYTGVGHAALSGSFDLMLDFINGIEDEQRKQHAIDYYTVTLWTMQTYWNVHNFSFRTPEEVKDFILSGGKR